MSRTGVGWRLLPLTSRTRPSFSVTSTRPSGKNAKPVGKLRLLTTVSSAKLGSTEPAAWIPNESPLGAAEEFVAGRAAGRGGIGGGGGTGPPQTQPVCAWRAWDSSAERVAASEPRPFA